MKDEPSDDDVQRLNRLGETLDAKYGVPPHHFDRQGKPIGLGTWAKLLEDVDYRVVAHDTIYDGSQRIEVSTIWLGLNHAFGDGRPLFFETMIFSADDYMIEQNAETPYKLFGGDFQRRYGSEEEAKAGHAETLALVRNAIQQEGTWNPAR